jgi:carbon-monoxide dehydrogenase medium subunit
MNLWQQYVRPISISEAIQALTAPPGPALPIAGGTDLLLDLQQGRHSPVHTLVDLTAIAEMNVLEQREGQLFIGAALPLSRIARHPLAARHAQALVEACDLVGGPQVRNVATLGGNVAHALPAADGTIALLALGAEAEIAGITGNRRVPFSVLFLGPGKSALKHGEELLVGFYVPLSKKGQASCFKRIMRPQGVALPIINLAIRLERRKDVIKDICIAVGPGAPTPWRAREAEKVLNGKPMNGDTLNTALEALLAHVGFRSSPRRASADYRRHLVGMLLKDTLEVAWLRTQAEQTVEARQH